MRTLLGAGAIGEIVVKAQTQLTEAGFDTKGTDGIYGNNTASAVKAFRSERSLALSSAIEESTWTALMNAPVPTVGERCLQLTANFENHGFGLAIGNFDALCSRGESWGSRWPREKCRSLCLR